MGALTVASGLLRIADRVRFKDGRFGRVQELRPIGDGELIHALVDLDYGNSLDEPTGYFTLMPASDDPRDQVIVRLRRALARCRSQRHSPGAVSRIVTEALA
jgi:hypothetical protein